MSAETSPAGEADSGNGSEDNSSCECPTCGRDDFEKRHYMKIHHEAAHNESLAGTEITCAWCGDIDTISPCRAESDGPNFCSKQCHANWDSENNSGADSVQSNRVKFECDYCGEMDDKTRSEYERAEHDFCSIPCRANFYAEKLETHEYWSSNGRVDVECDWCGEPDSVTPHEAEGRFFCDKKCFGAWMSENRSGEDSPLWGKGSFKRYGPNWDEKRAAVLDRDNHRCQSCGETYREEERSFPIHHIRPRKEFVDESGEYDYESANELTNLVVLCWSCHPKWEGIPVKPQLV